MLKYNSTILHWHSYLYHFIVPALLIRPVHPAHLTAHCAGPVAPYSYGRESSEPAPFPPEMDALASPKIFLVTFEAVLKISIFSIYSVLLGQEPNHQHCHTSSRQVARENTTDQRVQPLFGRTTAKIY